MKERLANLIKEALESLGLEAGEFAVEHPADFKMGDYSTNVGIKTGKAKEILAHLDTACPSGVERIELAGPGFINFYLSPEFFRDSLEEIIKQGDEFGKNKNCRGQKMMVEHTQPNPFKDFHIGHLMNNIIGEAVAGILKANGAEVKIASYHGDVGLHVAKAIWGMMENPKLSWGQAYTAGSENYETHKEEIVAINKKIYDQSDPTLNALYEKGRKESFENFEPIYKRLGSSFDYHFYEREAGVVGQEIIEKNIGKVFEKSEGATIFKGESFEPKTHTRVFLNAEGLPTYEAKEVGLAKIKREKWQYDCSVTITANEQDSFFSVVEVAIGQIFPELTGKLKHLSHGILRLSSGKMSSRTGDVITAEELIEDMKKKVKGDEAVAIGAIKYMILRQAIGHDIIFDIDRSISTEGDSGVYLQYAYARTNSLLEKARDRALPSVDHRGEGSVGEIREIEKLLYRFPEIVERAGQEYAPHHIITYLTELAGSFNNFYAHEQIIDDSPESSYRLTIARAFNITMKNGLAILGIPAPEKM